MIKDILLTVVKEKKVEEKKVEKKDEVKKSNTTTPVIKEKKSSTPTKTPTKTSKKNTPSKTPKTAYEFRRVWTSLKRRDWSEKYAYIMTLNSKIVKKLFSRSLEPEVLSDVISNIDKALSSGRYEDTKRIVEILKAFFLLWFFIFIAFIL